MSFSAATEVVLILIGLGFAWQAKRNHTTSKKMSGHIISAYFVLLAATIFLAGIKLALAAKASSIIAAVLLVIGLFGMKHSRDLVYLDFDSRRTPRVRPTVVDSRLAEFERVFAAHIILLAIALGLTSVIVWAILLLRRP